MNPGLDTHPWLILAVAGLVAAASGVVAVEFPLTVPVIAAGAVVVCVLASGANVSRLFLYALAALLAGYATLGRGFAYIGLGPVRVGEVVLALALLALVVGGRHGRRTIHEALLILFVVWGVVTTLPFIDEYRSDALRDGVVWGYALFALAVAATLNRPLLDFAVRAYARFVPAYAIWVPVAFLLWTLAGGLLPIVPGSDERLLVFKPGDHAVQLVGIAAFTLIGPVTSRGRALLPRTVLWGFWACGAAIVATQSRGGLLALAAGMAAAFALGHTARWSGLIVAVVCVVGVATAFGPTLTGTQGRSLSIEQATSNVTSLLERGDGSLEGTKQFRLDWWGAIVDYTFRGPHFWTGKGFGVNLADDDGFQTEADHGARAPHNSHLTVLARMGVPGLALWVALQVGFAIALLRAHAVARRAGLQHWQGIFAWLLVVWLAIMVNASFDPYLEGPQGGIWFWSVVGLGLAAIRLYHDGGSRSPS